MYHRFNEKKYPSTNIQIEIFKKQIEIIKKNNFEFNNPVEFDLKFFSPKSEKKILITIDDAFSSFYQNAWPYLKENKIFIVMLSRFMWEDLEKGVFRNYKRIKSVLKFNFIERVLAKNIDQQQKNRNLELLAIKSNYNQNNLYDTSLIFSGNNIILLKSEEIDVMLDDQEYFWEVKHSPKHRI